MKVKEINLFRRKMYFEIIKIKEVAEELKNSEQVYVYNIEEGTKHEIVVISKLTQLINSILKEHGFSEKTYVKRLYTVNKKLKIVW